MVSPKAEPPHHQGRGPERLEGRCRDAWFSHALLFEPHPVAARHERRRRRRGWHRCAGHGRRGPRGGKVDAAVVGSAMIALQRRAPHLVVLARNVFAAGRSPVARRRSVSGGRAAGHRRVVARQRRHRKACRPGHRRQPAVHSIARTGRDSGAAPRCVSNRPRHGSGGHARVRAHVLARWTDGRRDGRGRPACAVDVHRERAQRNHRSRTDLYERVPARAVNRRATTRAAAARDRRR